MAKVALVTGAGSGIGRSAALSLARAGFVSVVSDVNEKGGQETVRLITEAITNGKATFFAADVSKTRDVQALMKHIREQGQLAAAFNNAGIGGELGPASQCTVSNWDQVLSVNLTGVFLCCKHEIPLMLEGGGGSIVNCSSIYGKRGASFAMPYSVAKHGVLGLTKSLSLDLAAQKIRVNAVCPGFIDTQMVASAREQIDAIVAARQPIGRLGTPEEVGDAVAWLCSDAASFVTGTALDVDGAYLAG